MSIVSVSCNKNAHPVTAVPDKLTADTPVNKLTIALKHTLPGQLQESSGLYYTDEAAHAAALYSIQK